MSELSKLSHDVIFDLDVTKLAVGDPVVFLSPGLCFFCEYQFGTDQQLRAHVCTAKPYSPRMAKVILWNCRDAKLAERVQAERLAYARTPPPLLPVELGTVITRHSFEAALELAVALRHAGLELAEFDWFRVTPPRPYDEDCRRVRVFTRDPKDLATAESVAAWFARVEPFR